MDGDPDTSDIGGVVDSVLVLTASNTHRRVTASCRKQGNSKPHPAPPMPTSPNRPPRTLSSCRHFVLKKPPLPHPQSPPVAVKNPVHAGEAVDVHASPPTKRGRFTELMPPMKLIQTEIDKWRWLLSHDVGERELGWSCVGLNAPIQGRVPRKCFGSAPLVREEAFSLRVVPIEGNYHILDRSLLETSCRRGN
jgi:hypothetical protein